MTISTLPALPPLNLSRPSTRATHGTQQHAARAAAPAMTASTLAALPPLNLSRPSATAARKAKRQLEELMMVLLVTVVSASDLPGGTG